MVPFTPNVSIDRNRIFRFADYRVTLAFARVRSGLVAARILLAFMLTLPAASLSALEIDDVVGTWTLVSSTSRNVATGVVNDTFGANPKGWINYGRDGRMMVLIVGGGRPKKHNESELTDGDRAQLFKTMTAYSGTYSFKGDAVIHKIDTSWNEVWAGTSVIRTVKRQGDRLVYTTEKERGFGDGSPSVTTLVWERVK